MNSSEKELLQIIKNYDYNLVRLAETEQRLKSKVYSITPSYDSTGGGRANGKKSKVENFVEKTNKLKRDVAEYRRQLRIADAALHCPDLTNTEERILWWIASGQRLAGFAKREGIYSSRVYKIRDKALRKAQRHIKNTERSETVVKS